MQQPPSPNCPLQKGEGGRGKHKYSIYLYCCFCCFSTRLTPSKKLKHKGQTCRRTDAWVGKKVLGEPTLSHTPKDVEN